MVPLSNLPLLPASMPAAGLLSALGRHGFALVRASDALAYIEASDLLDRIQASAADDWRPSAREDHDAAGGIHP